MMTIPELRDYQWKLLELAETDLQSPNARVMLQLPTGGGKTHIAGALLARWLGDGRKAVWLTHRTELAGQTCRMLINSGVSAVNDLPWPVGDESPHLPNGVVILMVQTAGRRTNKRQIWDNYGKDDLLVVDEAHHAGADGWKRTINQWPGQVVGLTATPWRLKETEGFNHLFDERQLHCGPSVSRLQADGHLCYAKVLMPQPQDLIKGGAIAHGDYIESGIERANRDRPEVMTAGVLHYWQTHAYGRQTIIYAVSIGHARRLKDVFDDAGISADVMVTDTPKDVRVKAIKAFENGTLQVLVNKDIATEGFDLPDASCVVLTRPTKSLALYLQMVGRGLRPKPDGGDCLILDLAGNVEIHGLPEKDREWSLLPRGSDSNGDAPCVWCDKCNGVSPAASHFCLHCDAAFGDNCTRCVKWRSWKRWALSDKCGHQHEIVCDLCHLDAHIQSNLPRTKELKEVAIDPLLFAMADVVRRNLIDVNSRRAELESLIDQRECENANEGILDNLFGAYISGLSAEERPATNGAMGRTWEFWQTQRREEFDSWRDELAKLKSENVIEEEVRRECYEQLELADPNVGSKRLIGLIHRTLSGAETDNELAARKTELENRLYLAGTLREEEEDRLPNASKLRLKELRDRSNALFKDGRQSEFTTDENRERIRLLKPVENAWRIRLKTMKRQFEKHWQEILADSKS